jgi:nucleoside-diphosphate-sugar epimerase
VDAADGDAIVEDIGAAPDWTSALDGVACIVHLAARTHVRDRAASADFAEYRRVNVDGTRCLAHYALRAGVRRFIYVSSIKVNGEETIDRPFRESDPTRPLDAYGVTKREAEEVLTLVSREAAMEAVVLRPPLVYGPGVKGNFFRLMRLVARGVPLPFGSIENRRSLLYVDNLVDAIRACIAMPGAARRTFLVSDGEDLSTPQLISALARALQAPPRLLSCPPSILETVGRLIGRSGDVARLTRSLQVDDGLIRRELGWAAPCSVAEGLAATARWYHAHVDHRARAG